MHPLLSGHTTLLLAMGMCACVGLLHLGYVRRWRDPHLWVALWSGAALALQGGRLVQLETGDPEQALGAARFYAATSTLSIAFLCGLARSLSGRPTPRLQALGFCGFNVLLLAAVLGTPWFLSAGSQSMSDWLGRSYFSVGLRPPLAVPLIYLAWSGV
jgi:hypothetical protein